tara:strand:+ start:1048 stop:1824 length:777 start_codon:yes stop_codon:yes gene_type:complete
MSKNLQLVEEKKKCINFFNIFNKEDKFTCCICKNPNNIHIGYSSTGRKRYLCRCGARERQRGLLFLILFFTEICNQKDIKLLHTSPAFELSLINLVKSINPSINYLTSDIKDKSCNILLDLVNIQDEHINNYNYIINIHVLEHIRIKEDVFKVIDNIYSMLKDNGIAIIAVPQDFKLDIDILEDPNADPNPDHWRKFGCNFINLLDKFTKVELVFDTSFDIIKTKLITNDIQYKDLFLDMKREGYYYADGQVFYICHK